MTAPDLDSAIARLTEMVHAAGAIVPFTGAGISTECGIPDFRSPGGLWTKNRPIDFDAFMCSQEVRNESWRRRFAMEDQFGGAKPGRGHRAIANLYRTGKVPAVVTQNIDNLHQASGIAPEDVIELHGNTTFALCLHCSDATRSRGSVAKWTSAMAARPIVRAAAGNQDRDHLVWSGHARSGDAARAGIGAILRSSNVGWLVACGLARCRPSANG
jgi:NAD-dependent SIR2 family protein deacetylase